MLVLEWWAYITHAIVFLVAASTKINNFICRFTFLILMTILVSLKTKMDIKLDMQAPIIAKRPIMIYSSEFFVNSYLHIS